MTRNLYRLQSRDGQIYVPILREKVNALIEKGLAEWVGTDYNAERDAYIHYADRIEP